MTLSGQFSNSSEILSMSMLSPTFRKIRSKLNKLCSWQSQRLFQQSRGRNSRFNYQIWPVFKLIWDFIHVYLICKFQKDLIKTKRYGDDKVKQRLFQQSRWCRAKINDPIWPGFELIWELILIHLICKFQADPIKTEWVMLMTKSNKDFFSNQGDINVRLMIQSGQVLNSSEISSVWTLSASFRKICQNWISNTDDKVKQRLFSNQGDVTLRLMIWPDQFSNSFEISSMSILSASFRHIQSKLKELWWWQASCKLPWSLRPRWAKNVHSDMCPS